MQRCLCAAVSPRTRRERFNQKKGRESRRKRLRPRPPPPFQFQHGRQEESRIEQVPTAPEPPRERAARWHHDVTRDPDVRRTIVPATIPTNSRGKIAVWAEAQSEPPVARPRQHVGTLGYVGSAETSTDEASGVSLIASLDSMHSLVPAPNAWPYRTPIKRSMPPVSSNECSPAMASGAAAMTLTRRS